MTVPLRSLVAAAAGLALAGAFPPYGWWPLAVIGVALLGVVVAGCRVRAAFGYGVLAGAVFFGILVHWLAVVGMDAWLLLTGFSALLIGGTAAGMALVMRTPGWQWGIGAVWVAQEAIRDRFPFGGWPWGRLGFSQAEAPWVGLSALAGVPLLSFAVAASGGWLAWLVLRGRSAGVRAAAVVAAGLILVPVGAALVPVPATGQGAPATATVAVVQGDVPNIGLGFADRSNRRAVLDNHVRQTMQLAAAVAAGEAPQPEAVIWPENSSDLDPYTQPDAAAAITAAARAVGAPILVGAVVTNPGDPTTVWNVGIVWDPVDGPGDRYIKQHPVPFGEYVPFRDVLADLIGRFDLVPRDFAAGNEVGVLQVGPVLLGDVICFEVAYDEIVRDTVIAGARMLAVQTNNATYTGQGQSEQQAAMARIRAVEHGRSVAVAATNGISALFLPDGTAVGVLGERTAGFLVAELPLRDSLTPAARVGAWPELLIAAIAILLTFAGLRRTASVWPQVPGEDQQVAVTMEG